jgi:hypothetical protein
MKRSLIRFFACLTFAVAAGCQNSMVLTPTGPARVEAVCRSCSYYDDFSPPGLWFPSGPVTQSEWVIQDEAGWYEYAGALMSYPTFGPVTLPPPPVDLASKTLIAKVLTLSCGRTVVPRDICISPDRVRVTYEIDEECCPGWYFLGASTMLFALDKTDLPVVWEETFVPYTGPPCPTPVPVWTFDPPATPYGANGIVPTR